MTVPESLTDPDLKPVWAAIRRRLERSGTDNRGRVRLPKLPARSRHTLSSLIDRPVGTMVDLAQLEGGLMRLGVGRDLPDALAALDEPVSPQPAQRRAARREAEAARRRVRELGRGWPEGWAMEWIDEVISAGLLAGLDRHEAERMVGLVRLVVDRVPGPDAPSISRTDLAASVAGSAHALDEGTRLGAAVQRALRYLTGHEAGVWERAGVHPDLVSGAALTWGLAVHPGTDLEPLVSAASRLAVPLYLTQLTLRRHTVCPADGLDVLVVENPRVVEAAAQLQTEQPVVCTNGNPSGTVRLLLEQLLAGGAGLRYHGDFDPPGLAICRRMHRLGLRPWRMGAVDYRSAVEEAVSAGVRLPRSDTDAGPTPWDPPLQATFNHLRAVVHEERLLPALLVGQTSD